MGRKSLDGGTGESPVVGIRMTTAARERLLKASQAEGITPTEFARRALEAAYDREDAAQAS